MAKSKRSTVGKSAVTPCKHELLNRILGREAATIGIVNRKLDLNLRCVQWLDLTAGDGIPAGEDGVFHRNCSPGIMLHHLGYAASRSGLRISLTATELNPVTFGRLRANVRQSPLLQSWEEKTEDYWTDGKSSAVYLNMDARELLPPNSAMQQAVFIYNDPNTIENWCLTPEFLARCPKMTTSLSTLGCNPAGLKRLPRERRELWYDRIEMIRQTLQNWHDLCLFSVGNSDQWAYLISAPQKWRDEITKDCQKAFEFADLGANRKEPTIVWLREDEAAFRRLCDYLFLTKDERDSEGDAA